MLFQFFRTDCSLVLIVYKGTTKIANTQVLGRFLDPIEKKFIHITHNGSKK